MRRALFEVVRWVVSTVLGLLLGTGIVAVALALGIVFPW